MSVEDTSMILASFSSCLDLLSEVRSKFTYYCKVEATTDDVNNLINEIEEEIKCEIDAVTEVRDRKIQIDKWLADDTIREYIRQKIQG